MSCRRMLVAASIAAAALMLSRRATAVPAFPGAEGFGALATGGRGGAVYHVTRLDDPTDSSGNPIPTVGTFRAAVSGSNRIVVFDVGGVINIQSELPFSNNITIAGQTAPGGGVAVYGDGVSLSNRNNIVVRYMTFRQGISSATDTKAVNITNGYNIILDHTSIAWSRYDNFGISSNSHDITLQNSMSYEGINNQRSGGFVDSSRRITLARNLFANNQTRNPKGKGDLQYINNVIYNWRYGGYIGGHSSADWYEDLINNYFIKGHSSENNEFVSDFASTDQVYNSGNMVDLDPVDTGNDQLPEGRAVTASDFTSRGATVTQAAYNSPPVPVTVMSALDAYRHIVAGAGNSLHRDSADLRQIQDLTSLGPLGYVPADETQVGGMPVISGGIAPTDTDRDGMPDAWELSHGLNPNNSADGAAPDALGSGYTNVEDYLNSLATVPEPGIVSMMSMTTIVMMSRRRKGGLRRRTR